ncbi:MAG: hypothetical protein WBH10_11850 [Allopontixanthobacter sediminis]
MRFLLGLLASLAVSTSAFAAEWWEAKTDHFIVKSESSEAEARQLALDLERFDEAMRYMYGTAKDTEVVPDSSKLTMYHFGDTNDIGRLAGSRGVAGFFIPRAGQSVAFSPVKEPRQRTLGTRSDDNSLSPRVVMFHEYSHYFMYQHAAAAYPAWYREGFAEVYGTIELTDKGFKLGAPATHRALVLQYLNSYSVERLLDPPEKMNGEDVAQIYAMGWMLSHYLTFSGERKGQLGEYLRLINGGASSLDAGKGAFGDLGKLNRDLDRYRRGRAPGMEITYADYTPPTATTRKMTDAESEMMMLHIKSTRGVDEDEAKQLVQPARDLLARFPGSAPVQLAVAEAEFDAENLDRAESAAKKALEIDSSLARGHIYLARIAMKRAEEDPSQFVVAREQYAAANRLDPRNADPLKGYYLTYQLAGETPPEPALIALETAYDLAPFDPTIRTALAHLLLTEDRNRESIALLSPIINDPHASKRAKKLRDLVAKIEDGDKSAALAELAPKLNPEDEEEDEDDAVRNPAAAVPN